MLSGEVAQAKVLVTYPYEVGTEGAVGLVQDPRTNALRNLRNTLAIIRATGGVAVPVRTDQTRTEWVRTGKQVWNTGGLVATPSAGAYVEQFDAVVMMSGGEQLAARAGQARAESLSLMRVQGAAARTGPAVPLLRLLDNSTLLLLGNQFHFVLAVDSSGVPRGDISLGSGGSSIPHFANDPRAPLPSAYVAGYTQAYDTGDMRKILFGAVGQGNGRSSNGITTGARVGCRYCDSMATAAPNDTLILWDRQYFADGSTFTNHASSISFCAAWGAGSADDSLTAATTPGVGRPATEGAWEVVLMGLAHLDSLSGHKVLGNKIIRIAPIVYGGLARGPRHSWNWNKTQGIFTEDTTAFYAYLDSIQALGIPITFAVNVDSATAYARDVIKLKSINKARFTPQIWDGVDDSTATLPFFPTDVFGRYKKRAAVGDSMNHALFNGGSDNSIAWSARRALIMCDSVFGNRTSRIAVAPADDWSPVQVTGADAGGTGIDSVMYALQLAGYKGVVADAQDPDANASKTGSGPSRTNPRGYYNRQTLYNSSRIAALKGFKILTHSGFNVEGGRGQLRWSNAGARDSSTTGGGTFIPYVELGRLWGAALLDYDESYDNFSYDGQTGVCLNGAANIDYKLTDRTTFPYQVQHGSIYRLSCADLSGKQTADLVPAATCYHVLKAAANAMYIINKLAGRTVVQFDYPDNVQP
jgi:hypothetical protein